MKNRVKFDQIGLIEQHITSQGMRTEVQPMQLSVLKSIITQMQ